MEEFLEDMPEPENQYLWLAAAPPIKCAEWGMSIVGGIIGLVAAVLGILIILFGMATLMFFVIGLVAPAFWNAFTGLLAILIDLLVGSFRLGLLLGAIFLVAAVVGGVLLKISEDVRQGETWACVANVAVYGAFAVSVLLYSQRFAEQYATYQADPLYPVFVYGIMGIGLLGIVFAGLTVAGTLIAQDRWPIS